MKGAVAPWIKIGVTAYCVGQAADLGRTWASDSTERVGWLLFLVWLVPAVATFAASVRQRGAAVQSRSRGSDWGLWCSALVLTVLGELTWLNCLQHVALATCIVGLFDRVPRRWVWLAAAVVWMPSFGWLVERAAGGQETSLRLVLQTVVTLFVSWPLVGRFTNARKTRPKQPAPCRLRSSPSSSKAQVGRNWLIAATVLVSVCCCGHETHADTFTYSPVQSPARPLGLKIVDKVGLGGSDELSKSFMASTLPTMQKLIDENLGERAAITNPSQTSGLIALDPNALKLAVSAEVRAYFVGEGAGYHNSLGFNTDGGGVTTGNPLLVFPDASSPNSYLSSGGTKRTKSEPLMAGDFVNLGKFAAGTSLDFFLISDGANGGKTVFSTDRSINPDKIDHVVAFAQVKNPYVLIGFEDLFGGGDKDFNDLLFAVYLGQDNVNKLITTARLHSVPAPEPGLMWAIVFGCGGWLYRARRKRRDADAGTMNRNLS